MTVTEVSGRFVDAEPAGDLRQIVGLLTRAYWMEIETVLKYIAASAGDDDGRGHAVRVALSEGVEEEVEHARAVGRRIQELHGVVPAREGLPGDDEHPQAPGRQPDLAAMIEAVVATETSAIRHYLRIMRATAHVDLDTHALALAILRDEQRHLLRFEAYRRQYRSAPLVATFGDH